MFKKDIKPDKENLQTKGFVPNETKLGKANDIRARFGSFIISFF